MSVGTALSEARARAGLSLDEVAERTRIRRSLVEQIERDDFSHCGGDFYARGHIRSIAHVLGVDAEELVAAYDGEHPSDLPVLVPPALAHEREHAGDRRRPNWSLAMAAALAVVLGFGGYQAVTADGGSSPGVAEVASPQPSRPSTPAGSATAGGDGAVAAAPQTGVPTDAVARADEVEVEIHADYGPSWVSATTRSGRVLYQGTLLQGRKKVVRDPNQVNLLLGSAGGVRLVVNGEDVGTPGERGAVLRLSFGPDDPDGSGG